MGGPNRTAPVLTVRLPVRQLAEVNPGRSVQGNLGSPGTAGLVA